MKVIKMFKPGPWFLRTSLNALTVHSKPPPTGAERKEWNLDDMRGDYDEQIVQHICGFNWQGSERHATMVLISAAPAMLEALEKIDKMMVDFKTTDKPGHQLLEMSIIAREAMRKAGCLE